MGSIPAASTDHRKVPEGCGSGLRRSERDIAEQLITTVRNSPCELACQRERMGAQDAVTVALTLSSTDISDLTMMWDGSRLSGEALSCTE